MGIFFGGLVGFVFGVVFTWLFGATIAEEVKTDTRALVNGVETRVKSDLAAISEKVDELKSSAQRIKL